MIIFELWYDLLWWLRLIVALIFMGIGALMGLYISMRLGIVPFAIGLCMLFFGGKDDSEKRGYKF